MQQTFVVGADLQQQHPLICGIAHGLGLGVSEGITIAAADARIHQRTLGLHFRLNGVGPAAKMVTTPVRPICAGSIAIFIKAPVGVAILLVATQCVRYLAPLHRRNRQRSPAGMRLTSQLRQMPMCGQDLQSIRQRQTLQWGTRLIVIEHLQSNRIGGVIAPRLFCEVIEHRQQPRARKVLFQRAGRPDLGEVDLRQKIQRKFCAQTPGMGSFTGSRIFPSLGHIRVGTALRPRVAHRKIRQPAKFGTAQRNARFTVNQIGLKPHSGLGLRRQLRAQRFVLEHGLQGLRNLLWAGVVHRTYFAG